MAEIPERTAVEDFLGELGVLVHIRFDVSRDVEVLGYFYLNVCRFWKNVGWNLSWTQCCLFDNRSFLRCGIFYNGVLKLRVREKSDEFADMLITTFKKYNEKIRGKGIEYQDLTQISYSTIPTVDLELGDKKSDISDARLHTLSEELYDGIDEYMKVLYGKNS